MPRHIRVHIKVHISVHIRVNIRVHIRVHIRVRNLCYQVLCQKHVDSYDLGKDLLPSHSMRKHSVVRTQLNRCCSLCDVRHNFSL